MSSQRKSDNAEGTTKGVWAHIHYSVRNKRSGCKRAHRKEENISWFELGSNLNHIYVKSVNLSEEGRRKKKIKDQN